MREIYSGGYHDVEDGYDNKNWLCRSYRKYYWVLWKRFVNRHVIAGDEYPCKFLRL